MTAADKVLAIWAELDYPISAPASAFAAIPGTSASRARQALGIVTSRVDGEFIWSFAALERPEEPEPEEPKLADNFSSMPKPLGLPFTDPLTWITRHGGQPRPDDPREVAPGWVRSPFDGKWYATSFSE